MTGHLNGITESQDSVKCFLSITLVKCNFDGEIAMDVLDKPDAFDTVLLFFEDGDFKALVWHFKKKGKEAVSFELLEAAEKFIPAERLPNALAWQRDIQARTAFLPQLL
jgi:uncharacterized LabA/DUF88 family protein